jgi:hypothetical protein
MDIYWASPIRPYSKMIMILRKKATTREDINTANEIQESN